MSASHVKSGAQTLCLKAQPKAARETRCRGQLLCARELEGADHERDGYDGLDGLLRGGAASDQCILYTYSPKNIHRARIEPLNKPSKPSKPSNQPHLPGRDVRRFAGLRRIFSVMHPRLVVTASRTPPLLAQTICLVQRQSRVAQPSQA